MKKNNLIILGVIAFVIITSKNIPSKRGHELEIINDHISSDITDLKIKKVEKKVITNNEIQVQKNNDNKSILTKIKNIEKVKSPVKNKIEKKAPIEIDSNILKELREKGLITEEEYLIETGEEINQEGIQLYTLYINGEKSTETYQILSKDDTVYFPIFSFFKLINFRNYDINNNILIANMGDNLTEILVDLKNNKIMKNNSELLLKKEYMKVQEKEIYLKSEVFRELFLTNLAISKDRSKINITLNFSTPEEIKIRQKNNKRLLNNKKEQKEFLFTNKKKLFELGYLRTEFNQIFKKNEYIKNGEWENDWEANLEYQGAFLYGEITANYDVRNKIFEDIKQRYDNFYKEHTLEIGNYKYMDSGAREWELSLKKDKGYIVTGSKNYVIKENVPIGSRVELLYLGVIIDIKDSENGVVEFTNDEIKEDREYMLKIYTPEGKILEKIINTTSNYNQQNKGEIEYDINIRENHEIEKPTIDSKIYYGLTDNLTIGLGYLRDPELINNKYEYLDKGRLEGIYSNYIYSMPYTFRVGGDKVFNEFEYKLNEKNTKDDYSYDLLGQIDINKVRLRLEHEEKGEFYEDKSKTTYYARVTPIKALDIEYEREELTKNDGVYGVDYKENSNKYSIEYSKSYKNLLLTSEYEHSTDEKGTYRINTYYTGFRTSTMKLENSWKNNGKDYEVAFSLFSNGNRFFDYNVEARYSEENKDVLTFRFSTNYNNWFNYDMLADKKGNQEHKIGVDKITDLRNIRKTIKNMDSSPVKIITFVDKNDNNKFDKGESLIKGVEVKLGEQKLVTDKNGEAHFFGVPNEVIYEIDPIIKKPNFLLGDNKIHIQGKDTSTIIAHIPIKPMLTLTGIINIDDILKLSNIEKIMLYDDLLITIKDINGKIIDRSIPDEMGIFEVSGLLPKEYIIEVTYMGIDHQIKGINNKLIKLSYLEDNEKSNYYVFDIKTHGISMNQIKGDKRI